MEYDFFLHLVNVEDVVVELLFVSLVVLLELLEELLLLLLLLLDVLEVLVLLLTVKLLEVEVVLPKCWKKSRGFVLIHMGIILL